MRTRLLSIALFTIVMLPRMAFAQCHHMSSQSHVHVSSSHSHTHYSYHPHCSEHYHNHYHSYGHRSYGYSGGGTRLDVPLQGTHEFSAGGGWASAWEINDQKVLSATPNLFASYKYYFSKGAAIGISAGTQTTWGKDSCHCNVGGNAAPSLYNFGVTTMTVAADFSWLLYSKGAFQLYQGVSAGVSRYMENDTYVDKTTSSISGYKFNGQVSLVGVRFGKTFGGFVELGYGYKGLLSGGISYQAGYKRSQKWW